MKATNDLFELISNLTGSEKRYFKINAARHVIGEANHYVHLFDLIHRQKEYDEEAVIRQAGKGTTRHTFASEKHYLHQNILRSLCEFHSGRSALYRLHEQLNAIEILFEKGLYEQCRKLIRKAKEEGYAYEKFHQILAVLRWSNLLAIRDGSSETLFGNLAEMKRIYAIMDVQTNLMHLAFDLKRIMDSGKTSAKILNDRSRKLDRAKKFAEKQELGSFLADYYYYSGKAIIAFHYGRDKECLNIGMMIKELFERQPDMMREMANLYAQNLYNLINVAVSLRRYREALAWLGEQKLIFRDYNIRNAVLERAVFIFSHERELMIYCATGDFKSALQVTEAAEKRIRKPEAFGAELYDLFFFLAIVRFSVGDIRKATRWLNRVMNPPAHISIRTEMAVYTRLFYLLVLAESQDRLYRPRLKSTRRFLEQHGLAEKSAHMLEAIQVLSDYRKNPTRTDALERLSARIRPKNSREWMIGDFDFPAWIEHRRTGRPFGAILLEKNLP